MFLFIGQTVQVVYDPANKTEVTIEYEGSTPWKALELVTGERAGKRPALPEHLQCQAAVSPCCAEPSGSMNERTQIQTPAVSYRMLRKETAGVWMFESFYDMTRTPFKRGIPVTELYLASAMEEISDSLQYADERQLFAVFTGDCGTGKTTTGYSNNSDASRGFTGEMRSASYSAKWSSSAASHVGLILTVIGT